MAIKLVHTINKTAPAPTIASYPISWEPYLPGLLVVTAGLLYARKPGSWFELDKTKGMVTFKRHRLSPTIKYPIQDIKAIAVEEKQFTETEEIGEYQRSYLGYRVSLVLASGQLEHLVKTYRANPNSKREAAEAIRTFLQLPPVIFQQGK